ncbi:MAG: SpoIIE family protein phosphatase [Salinivirgaceae bacterium]|nr:SpoIIE family protein phosphatase [Salinivirgaceae bacterium]
MKYFFALLIAVFTLPQFACSQEESAANMPEIDSILNLIARQTNDEEIAKLYNDIVHLPGASFNTMIKYALLSLEHCPSKNIELLADNYNRISYSYINLGNPEKSLEYTRPLIKFYTILKNNDRMAIAYDRMANIFSYLNQPDSIFHYYNKALQVYENNNDTLDVAECYYCIGVTNLGLSFNKTAEEYFRKALAMDSAIGNEIGIARDYMGIGSSIYNSEDIKESEQALLYLKKAADGFEKATIDENDIQNIINKYMSFQSLSEAYIKYAEVGGKAYADSCRIYLDKIGSFFEDIEFEGMVWKKQYAQVKYLAFNQKYDEALRIMLDLETRLDNGELDREISYFFDELYHLYIKKGDYQNACIAQRKHYEKRLTEVNDDALASAANAKTEQALMYERKITTAEKQKMRIVIFSLIGGLFLISLLVFYIFRVLSIKKKANAELLEKNAILIEQKEEISAQRDEIEEQRDEIEAQRDHIEEQSKEIQSSINYARRIQRSMLPPNETITSIFPEHFLLYKPRDIVSGDYYWVGQFGDNKICIVADCTGHGVPGGFLSVLGMSNLNYIVGQDVSPDAILNRLREAIISNLRQSDNSPSALQEEEDSASDFFRSSDGMDAVVYIVNERQMTLTFAGANNSLVLIRGDEVQVLKGDRMPVGIYARLNPFQSTTIDIQKGDCIYTFSDGFQDQFEDGGVNNKFTARRLRQLLLEIHQQPMAEQKEIMNRTFEQWRGPAENQTDDVVVMGVRI